MRAAAQVLRLVLVGCIKWTRCKQTRLAFEPVAKLLQRILWHARTKERRIAHISPPLRVIVVVVGGVRVAVSTRGSTRTTTLRFSLSGCSCSACSACTCVSSLSWRSARHSEVTNEFLKNDKREWQCCALHYTTLNSIVLSCRHHIYASKTKYH